jgi:hypothetical protein
MVEVTSVCAGARRESIRTPRRRLMKRTIALALATFLGLGLLSYTRSVAQDALHGVTTLHGCYCTN